MKMNYIPHLMEVKTITPQVAGLIDSLLTKAFTSPPKAQADFETVYKMWSQTEKDLMAKAPLFNQGRGIWIQAVIHKLPTVWFVRQCGAVDAVYDMICNRACVTHHNIANAWLHESDLPRISRMLADLANSPLWICENTDSAYFGEVVGALSEEGEFFFVACDWSLEAKDLGMAHQVSRNSKIAFQYPA